MLVKSENCAVISYMIQSIVWLQYVKYSGTSQSPQHPENLIKLPNKLSSREDLDPITFKDSDHLILFLLLGAKH